MTPKELSMTMKEWFCWHDQHPEIVLKRIEFIKENIDSLNETFGCLIPPPPPPLPKAFIGPSGGSGPPRLLIGLGTYNFDEIFRLQEKIYIDYPTFITTKGKTIIPTKIFMTVPWVNGVINFGMNDKLRLVKNTVVTLLLLDENNFRYLVKIDTSQDEIESVFVVEDVTEKTKTLKQLKTTLDR